MEALNGIRELELGHRAYDFGMLDSLVAAAARELLDMRRSHRIEVDVPADCRPETMDEAYRIQAAVVQGLLHEGGRVIGYKAACTSTIAQTALRIDHPVFGRLLSHSSHASGVVLSADAFVHRVVEAEFAFRIRRDIETVTEGHGVESIRDCIDAVIPSIEIVDYRYDSWTIGAPQVAADNAIHGCWISGSPLTDWQHLDLENCRVGVTRNGELVTTGSGAAVLGHPLAVMAWIADELPRYGLALRAGDVVTTGVTTDVFEAVAGDHIEARFEDLGSVAVGFTE